MLTCYIFILFVFTNVANFLSKFEISSKQDDFNFTYIINNLTRNNIFLNLLDINKLAYTSVNDTKEKRSQQEENNDTTSKFLDNNTEKQDSLKTITPVINKEKQLKKRQNAQIVAGSKKARSVVRIGHIGAIGALPNDDKILNISRIQLFNEGILGEDFDIQVVSKVGCGDSFEGVAVAAQMYHKEKIRAFIGPYCNVELEAVAKMGSFWNIPIISYIPTATELFDRSIYKTLARTSSKSTNSMAKAVVKLIRYYHWKKVAIVTNTGSVAFERVLAFEEELQRLNINIVKKIMLEENWDTAEMIRSGYVAELIDVARIVICIFSYTGILTQKFMQATFKLNINNNEFVYILPWLQSGLKDASSWIGSSGEMLQQTNDHYANAIIVDDVKGFDNSIIDTFITCIEKYGLKREDIDMTNIFGYLHLYDTLKLYALAARKLLNVNQGNISYVTDGYMMWNKMRGISFKGIGSTIGGTTGTVVMDELADRAPQYAAFYIAPNRGKFIKIVNMNSFKIPNCDGLVNKTGCLDLKLTNMITGFWPSPNGSMPLDEPFCGFRGQHCSYTIELSVGGTVVVLIVLLLVTFTFYRYCQTRALNKMPWRIFSDNLRFINDDQAKSLLSLGSANIKMSILSVSNQKHAILGVNTHAMYQRYPQKRPIKLCRKDLYMLTQMKQAIHENLNPFLGILFNEKDDLLVVWKFCLRGTVQDIIYNKSITLNEKFHAAFVRDIVLGLEYLHSSSIGYHGSLTPWSCVIDRNWNVRLTDYGLSNSLDRWKKEGAISINARTTDDDQSQALQRFTVLYRAPEMLQSSKTNCQLQIDQIVQSQVHRKADDIYAFGMVMYEILFRSLPFSADTDIYEFVHAKADEKRYIKPQIQSQIKIHPDLAALLIDCWSQNPEIRPSIRRVRINTEIILKWKGSLVDQIMRVMEQYANNLEKIVKNRTGMLEEANLKADRLINQLLPPFVANELKLGRPVPPRLFLSATVLFSDIVGFTTLCSNSSPLEVVNLLNGVYTGFDEIILKHKSYKVETVGDAYMVVSGIPEENGTRHVFNIANIALAMRQFLVSFEIPHRKAERIKCKWGFHTGNVAAGVIGMTTPRYCLFGDTVNTASRMESTGLPKLIQISQVSYDLLLTTYPEFKCTRRGEVEIKGKGLCLTYWLNKRANRNPAINGLNV